MKTRLLLKSLFLVILALWVEHTLWAKPSYEETRRYNKDFALTKGQKVKVSNEFGKIHVETWSENKVSFDVEIIVNNRDESKAKEFAGKMDVKFVETKGSMISCEARIPDYANKGNENTAQINIRVKVPEDQPLDLDNSFGDVFLSDYKGVVNLKVNYGRFQGGAMLGNESSVEIGFGGGTWGNMAKASVKVSYSDFQMGNSTELSLNSQFSEGELDKVDILDAKVNYGKLQVDKAQKVAADLQFSGMELDELVEEAVVKSFYGEGLEIDRVKKGFRKVDLKAQFSKVDLSFESGCAFILEAEVDFGDLDYEKEKFRKINVDKAEYTPSAKYKGVYGDQEDPSSRVFIRADYSNIEIN